LWSTAVTRLVAQDLKGHTDKDYTLQKLGFVQYAYYLLTKLIQQCNRPATYGLIALNVLLISLFLYFFFF
uniref:Bestrophin homolog n=1 Tax=Gongylonema pulchrum TaxID=637853 RepID=A0A183ELH0_9BILA